MKGSTFALTTESSADLETLLPRRRDGLLLFLPSFVRDLEYSEDLLQQPTARNLAKRARGAPLTDAEERKKLQNTLAGIEKDFGKGAVILGDRQARRSMSFPRDVGCG